MASVGAESRWWSGFLRRSRRRRERNGITNDGEISVGSSTELRNNIVDTPMHASPPPPKTRTNLHAPSPQESALDDVYSFEGQLLTRTRLVVTKAKLLWQSDMPRRLAMLLLFVSVCVGTGLCLRAFREQPAVKVHSFLHRLDLDAYLAPLLEKGYDQLDDIIWATEEDLELAGIYLKAHRHRILRTTHSMQVFNYWWILWMGLAIVVFWILAGAAFLAVILLHEEFRHKCRVVALWTAVTLWGRLRVYRRIWRELEERDAPAGIHDSDSQE